MTKTYKVTLYTHNGVIIDEINADRFDIYNGFYRFLRKVKIPTGNEWHEVSRVNLQYLVMMETVEND